MPLLQRSHDLFLRRPRVFALAAAALLVAVNAGSVGARLGFAHPPGAVLETDHFKYIAMAKGPESIAGNIDAHRPPFCYRVLVPWLAHALTRTGLGLDASFYLLSQLMLLLFLFTLFAYLCAVGLAPGEALVGLGLAGLLQGAGRWYAYQYWMTDPTALFLVALAFLWVEQRRDAALVAVTTLAAATRETTLLILPYFFLQRLRRDGLAAALRGTLELAIAPLAVLGLIHYYVVALPRRPLLEVLASTLAFRWDHLFDNQLYFATLGSFGVLVPLLLMFPRRAGAYLREHVAAASAVAICYATLALGNNTDRLLAYALPALLPVCLLQLRHLADAARVPYLGVALAATGLQLLLWSRTKLFGVPVVSVHQPFDAVVTAAMLCFLLAGVAASRLRAGARLAPG